MKPGSTVAEAGLDQGAYVQVPCPKCGSEQSARVFTGEDYLHGIGGQYHVSACRACGFWFHSPRPEDSLHHLLYPSDYLPHTALAGSAPAPSRPGGAKAGLKAAVRSGLRLPGLSRLRAAARRRRDGIDLVPDRVPDGRLLEIGCASGRRLQSLREAGWSRLHGIEMVPEAAAKASALGFAVESGRVEDALPRYPDGHFDVIVTSMVMEHFCNPFEVTRAIARKLRPGGQFLFSTIVRDSLDARLYGKYWAGFDFPRHMVHFRLRDVRDMLARDFTGLTCHFQNAPVDFERSSAWRKGHWDGLLAGLFASRAGRALGLALALTGRTSRVSFRCRRK